LLGDHKVVGILIAVDRQEKMDEEGEAQDKSAVEYLEETLGIKVFSIQNIKTIYNLIKNSLDEEMRRLWVDYYKKYSTVSLE